MRIPSQSLGVVRGSDGAFAAGAMVKPAMAINTGGGGLGYASCSSCDEGYAICCAGCAGAPWPFSAACVAGCTTGWRICKAFCSDDVFGGFGGGNGVFIG